MYFYKEKYTEGQFIFDTKLISGMRLLVLKVMGDMNAQHGTSLTFMSQNVETIFLKALVYCIHLCSYVYRGQVEGNCIQGLK